MSDIFREVEEDVRRDKLQKIWKQYGDYIIAAASAVIIGFAGWQLWSRYQENQKAEAAAAYSAAHVAAAGDKAKDALAQFETLVKDAPKGYVELAELSKANTLAATGKSSEAIAAYKAFAEKYKDAFGDAARVRAGWLMADSAKLDELIAFLKPVTDQTGSGFGPAAREVIAYAYYRAGNLAEAQKRFEAMAKDNQTTQGIAQRAEAMATFIKAGGNKDAGTVPPVVEPAPTTGTATP